MQKELSEIRKNISLKLAELRYFRQRVAVCAVFRHGVLCEENSVNALLMTGSATNSVI